MRLVGTPCPTHAELLDLAEQEDQFAYPPSYRTLLETWGLGHLLGDHIRMLDPTDRGPESEWLQWRTQLEKAAITPCHERPYIVDPWVLQTLVVFAQGPHYTLAWDICSEQEDGEYHIWLLDSPQRSGQAYWFASSLHEAVEMLLTERIPKHLHPYFSPGPGGHWSFNPVYCTTYSATQDYVVKIVELLEKHQERAAWRVLDEALSIVPKYNLYNALARTLGPNEGSRFCTLALNPVVYLRWLRFVKKSIRAHLPGFDQDHAYQDAIDELESRSSGRILFDLEHDSPLKVLARVRRHSHKPLFLEIFAQPAVGPSESGKLTLSEHGAHGECLGVYEHEIDPRKLSEERPLIWRLRHIHGSARLHLFFTPDEVIKVPVLNPHTLGWSREEVTR